MQCPQNKDASGLEHSPTTPTPLGQTHLSNGLEDNSNGVSPDFYTGNSWSPSPRRLLWPLSKEALVPMVIGNCASPKQQATTCGKTPLPSPTQGSSLDNSLSGVTLNGTGTASGNLLLQVLSMESLHKSKFVIMGLSEESALTIKHQLEWCELVTYSGVQLELESQGELGKKGVWTVTLKTRGQR